MTILEIILSLFLPPSSRFPPKGRWQGFHNQPSPDLPSFWYWWRDPRFYRPIQKVE